MADRVATATVPNVRPTEGGSCERCRSFDSGGVGEAGAGDHGGSGGVAAEAGAAAECAAHPAAAGVVFVRSGVGSADYAGALDFDAGACDGSGSSGASV